MAALCMVQGARVVATHASFMCHMTSSSSPGFPFQARSKQPLNPSSLLLPRRISKVGLHSIQEPKRSSAWSSQTDSNDQQESAPTGKNQVSKVEKLSEESGGRPPVLTIAAGISVFLTILWVIWSLLSWLVGIFLR